MCPFVFDWRDGNWSGRKGIGRFIIVNRLPLINIGLDIEAFLKDV